MNTLYFLLLFPAAAAILLFIIPNHYFRRFLVWAGTLVIAGASVYLSYTYLGPAPTFFSLEIPWLEKAFFAGEVILSLYLLFRCKNIVSKEWWIPVLIAAQAGVMIYCELKGPLPAVDNAFYIDNFSIIMALIIGIIGTLICVYAISYMKEYHEHHHDVKNRQGFFFFLLFLFLSAMFGVVFANNLMWLYFFWEITTLCSFEMIGYARTSEATRNSYLALGMNSIGGLAFAGAVYYLTNLSSSPTIELSTLLSQGKAVALIPAILISFAGLTKSAQMPFSSWLLGAMIAPTPVSALLHSSTMVKAGVFVIIKFAPVLEGTVAGLLLAFVGGITFLMTSLLAVTQSNAKRVLAYSTIANLGLIVMCAGVGTYQALWAGILLLIFHAIAKGLLFLGVGTIEHRIGSRDIEDMDGLISSRPAIAMVMIIGILGMFLAPFGMLISKWACIEALVISSPILAIVLAFGSAPTLFFWAKWMGKIASVPLAQKKPFGSVHFDEWSALGTLAIGTVIACGLFPWIARASIEPYIQNIYFNTATLTSGNTIIMLIMLGLMVLLPISFLLYPRKIDKSSVYLAGANMQDNASFMGSMGIQRNVTLQNYYLTTFMTEQQLTQISVITTILTIIGMFAVLWK